MVDGRSSAALALQRLTLSDAAARANMLRHLGATRLLLTGRLDDAPDLRLLPAAGFRLTRAAAERLTELTHADGNDRLWITFDVDDGLGPPIGIDLFHRPVARDRILHLCCRLWAPAISGPMSLVFRHAGGMGRLESGRHGLLRRRPGPGIGDVERGTRLADERLQRALDSRQVREFAVRTAFRIVLDCP